MPKKFQLADSAEDREVIDTFDLDEHIPADPDAPDGSDSATDRTVSHTFTLLRPPDSAKLMSLQLASRFHAGASDETKFRAVGGVIDYLGACMSAGEYEDLYGLLVSPRSRGMDLEPLFQMCKWVLEVTTDRPTKPSTGSARGRSGGGKSLTGNSPRKAARTRPASTRDGS